jgi:hypothetical protein
MGMKSISEDGGACWQQWYRTRHSHLLSLSGLPPIDLCSKELALTVGCRYAQQLLENPRILRFLVKNHPVQLRAMQALLATFNQSV